MRLSHVCFVVSTDPDMDRLLRLGGGMPGLGQVKESRKCELTNIWQILFIKLCKLA